MFPHDTPHLSDRTGAPHPYPSPGSKALAGPRAHDGCRAWLRCISSASRAGGTVLSPKPARAPSGKDGASGHSTSCEPRAQRTRRSALLERGSHEVSAGDFRSAINAGFEAAGGFRGGQPLVRQRSTRGQPPASAPAPASKPNRKGRRFQRWSTTGPPAVNPWSTTGLGTGTGLETKPKGREPRSPYLPFGLNFRHCNRRNVTRQDQLPTVRPAWQIVAYRSIDYPRYKFYYHPSTWREMVAASVHHADRRPRTGFSRV